MRTIRQEDLSFEPSLHEMLADPVIQAVMTRDGITHDDLLRLALVARMRLLRGVVDDGVVTKFPIGGADAGKPWRLSRPEAVAAGDLDLRPRTRWPFSVRRGAGS